MKRANVAFAVLFVFLLGCKQEETAGPAQSPTETVASTESQAPAKTDEFATVRDQVGRATAEQKGTARQALIEKKVTADAQLDRAWSEFRRAYPYHIQEIAMSAASNGARTVIVAEPPPNVSLDDMLFATGPNLVAYEVKKKPIGYDGWVKDVVLKIKGDDAAASTVASRLTTTLFQTSYKAHILPLPPKPRHARVDLDLNVTPAEMRKWIFTDHETFMPILGGKERSVDDVFASHQSTVYFSGRRRGLVGWWIPKGAEIDSMAAEARQFALDSDLIIGAIARPGGVFVLARERAVDVDDLPPLRFESIALFAAVEGSARNQLEQSYERTAKFAGEMSRGRDWAPIHLSPELVDTEYGSLLNITDQLLKGWSNAGETRYVNFSYPRPSSFPFPRPLPDVLNSGRLTYNWNTTGVGYTVVAGDREVFALYRTGALPTSYIPEGMKRTDPAVLTAEDTGYQYFAGLDDPNLVRVVQYAALYQIFTTFDVKGTSTFLRSNDFPKRTRRQMEAELSKELDNASDADLDALSAKLASAIASNEAARTPGHMQVKSFAKQIGPEVRRELKAVRSDIPPLSSRARAIRVRALSAFAEMHKVPERLAQAVGDNANEGNGWIHTPVVVISENRGDIEGAVGGHNLYSAVTRFEVANEVEKGMPAVTAEGRLRLNPADEAKAHELLRIAARDAKNKMGADEIASDLRNAMRRIRDDIEIRDPLKALKLAESASHFDGTPPKPPFRGRRPTDHGGSSGWGMNFGGPSIPERGAVPGALIVERRPDRTIRIVFADNREAHASNAEDATDAVVQILKRGEAGDGGVRMVMRGFDENDGRSFVESCNLRSKAADREISALIESRRIDPAAATEILARKYNWSGVRINEPTVEMREGRQHATLVIDIPREDGAGAARTDLTLAFHRATPEPVAKTLAGKVRDSITRIVQEKKAELNAFTFNWRVNAEVKALSRKTGVPIEVVRQQFVDAQHDFVFAELRTYDFFQEIDEPRRRPA